MNRRGWTLQEMLISLLLTSGVVALAAHQALAQLRYFQGVAAVIAMRGQIGHASSITARALWPISPAAGDIILALDSALAFHATIGTAVACDGSPGRVTIPAPLSSGNTLSAFWEPPDANDRVHVFFDDSVGAGWLTLQAAARPGIGGICTAPTSPAAWLLELREPIVVPAGAPILVTRPVHFSLYRASDNRWYLGAKDWNSATKQFNAIQPVAGPLLPYSANPATTGLLFAYRDASGSELLPPADPGRIASITITSRAATSGAIRVAGLITAPEGTYSDSSSVTVAFRNAR